jgi:hypothetical protein
MNADRFWHGCNYPWSTDGHTIYYGLDFGDNIWGSHLGVSTRQPEIERDFASMAALGFTVARWFLFGDGRAGIVYDDRGIPIGCDAHLFEDVDAALEIAGRVGVRIAFVLLDHHWMFDGIPDVVADPASGRLVDAPLLGGRAHVLISERGRDALLARVIEPLVTRYGHSGSRADLGRHLFAIELMNEPDFVVREWSRHRHRRVSQPLRFDALAELVTRLSAMVHASTGALSTIGCARLDHLTAWNDPRLGLDCVQLHTYPDTMHLHRDRDVYGIAAAALASDLPVVLGEFPGDGPRQHPVHAHPPPWTLNDYLEFALNAGYAGAWPWSFSGTDAYGRFPHEPLREFARRYPDLVNPFAHDAEATDRKITPRSPRVI